jgi:uncharacterized BrkB/YihY/UPF0761 family membrane protein
MSTLLLSVVGLVVGAVVGFTFGTIQNAAFRRNEGRRLAAGEKSGWSYIPGSMTRVALLLIALVLIQVFLPMLFNGNFQWVVSAGVVIGYGWSLFRLRRKSEFRYRISDI